MNNSLLVEKISKLLVGSQKKIDRIMGQVHNKTISSQEELDRIIESIDPINADFREVKEMIEELIRLDPISSKALRFENQLNEQVKEVSGIAHDIAEALMQVIQVFEEGE